MKTMATLIAAGAITFSLGACQLPLLPHKLVATNGEHTVSMYPDEHTFVEVSHREQSGGVTGVVGDVQKNFTAKQIDDQTPVKVLATDDNGSQVLITDGPMRGQSGFVAHQNVD
ncbi:MAG TPA: hypothetical protein VEJ86_09475 [Candidatus Binataceae bacterium]|nr:hypothetical protein [Candidatus Binataceae bacterium]